MAEVSADVTTTTQDVAQDTTQDAAQDATPTVEELMAELAQEKADRQRNEAKLKADRDAALKKAGDATKQLRAKQTIEEQEEEARQEAERAKQEEFDAVKAELNHIKAVSAYKSISDEQTVETLIEAITEADHTAIASIIEAQKAAAVKQAQAEWMKSRPPVNAGTGKTMNKDEILAITDQAERQRAIAENVELFQKS